MGGRRELPVWRSMLFVPVTVRKFVDGAAKRGADAIILDLEDSVPVAEKPRARSLLQEAAEIVARGGADVVVRINRPLRMAIADIEAAVSPRVAALALPKIESAEHLCLLAEVVDEVEAERGVAPGTIKLLAMVETASAFFRMAEIARAHPRLVAMTLGAEDFALSVGMIPEAEGLFFPKQQMIIAARAAGIMPLGFLGTVADFRDLEAFRATLKRSRRLGFMGASVIHPAQVPILNEEFAPTAEEVAHAERLVAAYDKATAEGVGAIVVDGKMIDVPVVERAQALLARYRAIAARQAKRPG
jgi:citrate lyase subunit beta/citryl-CoA lyase